MVTLIYAKFAILEMMNLAASHTKSPYYLLDRYRGGYSVDEISDNIEYVYNFGTGILDAGFKLYDSQGRKISFVATKATLEQIPQFCAFNSEINPDTLGIKEEITEPSDVNVELIKRSLITSIILRYSHTIFRPKNNLTSNDLNGCDLELLTSIYALSNRKLRSAVNKVVSK